MLLQRVPDVKRQKNRLHLDLRTLDLEAETARVLDLGATLLTSQPVLEDGWRWHVLADPDGNEFCVLQPPERPSSPALDSRSRPLIASQGSGLSTSASMTGAVNNPLTLRATAISRRKRARNSGSVAS